MLKIKKNDTIQVTKGKDKGKRGRVIEVLDSGKKALVQGINMLKKHKRRTQQDQQGGIVSIEKGIAIGNIMLVCKTCDKPVKVGFSILQDGTKTRICKVCKEVF